MDCQGVIQDRKDWPGESPSIAIADAIALLEDLEPVELPDGLGFTLYEYVDPEALDSLVTDSDGVGVSLELVGYSVRVAEKQLRITEIPDP